MPQTRAIRLSFVAPKKKTKKIIRKQMADLMEDQEPVMKGPQFNSVVALNKFSHEEFITRAKENLSLVP